MTPLKGRRSVADVMDMLPHTPPDDDGAIAAAAELSRIANDTESETHNA